MRVPGIPGQQVAEAPLPSFTAQDPYAKRANPLVPVQGMLEEMNKAREVADTARVEEQLNALRRRQIGLTEEYQQQKGKNVTPGADGKTFTDKYMEQFNEATGDLNKQLTKSQQALFTKRAALVGTEFMSGVANHEGAELLQHQANTHADTIEMEAQNSGSTVGDPKAQALAQARIDTAVSELAKLKGLSDTGTALMRQKAYDNYHTNIVSKLVDKGDLAAAQSYLLQNAGDMSPDQTGKLQDYVDKKGAILEANTAVDKVWAEPALDYAGKAAAIRAAFATKPDSMHAALQALAQRKQEYDVAQDEAAGSVWDMVTGLNKDVPRRSFLAAQATPQWAKLDGAQRRKFEREYASDQRAKAAGGPSPAQQVGQYATFNAFMEHPDQLLAMKPGQISALTGVIGEDLVKRLFDEHARLVKAPDKLTEAKMDASQFKTIAAEYGVKSSGKLNETQLARLGQLRTRTMDVISVKQRQLKRELNDQEKEEVLRSEFKQIPTRTGEGFLSNMMPSLGKSKYAFEVGGANEIGASDDEKERAYNYLKANNAEPTIENMWAMIEHLRSGQ